MRLDELELGIHFENTTTEFKQVISDTAFEGWLKTVAGFANANGGVLYVGVNDEDTALKGFSHVYADKIRNIFNNKVNEHLFPKPNCSIEFLKYLEKERELYVLKIIVAKNSIRPVVMTVKGVPAIYMRRDGYTNGATYDEIISMSIASKNVQFDNIYSEKQYRRENFQKLFAFYKEHSVHGNKELTDKALSSLGFFNAEGMLANGALLFEDDYKQHEVDLTCSVFAGFNRGQEKIVALNRFAGQGNLLDSVKYALDFVKQRMNHSLMKTTDGHVDLDAYPARALLEGIINAVAHRNYFLTGTQIQVDMFRDRLEIASPGGFYERDVIPKTFKLSSVMSVRRNKLISDVLVKCNVMEAAGTGFDKIIEDYAPFDEKHQPYIFASASQFVLVLPDLTYEPGVETDLQNSIIYAPVEGGSEYDRAILAYCYFSAKNVAQLATQLKKSNSSYLRNIINNLVEQKYLIVNQVGRAKYYRTNRELVKLE